MSQPHPDSEKALENAAIALFANLGWETINCYQEVCGVNGTLERETRSEVVLVPRLRSTLEKLNPDLPPVSIELAIDELTRDRSTLSLANANREIYQLKGLVAITFGSSPTTRNRARSLAPCPSLSMTKSILLPASNFK